MRIGYSWWGFLSDRKLDATGRELSTPDGNATYSWALIHELTRRGHTVYMMQQDRDRPGWLKHGPDLFSAFSTRKRVAAYLDLVPTDGYGLPELDMLLLEWRFPIPGRNVNVDRSSPEYQPDLDRQVELLRHYGECGTKVVIWDLDHKLTELEEQFWCPAAILETSTRPRMLACARIRVEPPVIVEDLLQFPTQEAHPFKKLVYVGSRYERDDVITEYIRETSEAYPGQVEFWGNWLNSVDECRRLWPDVSLNGRITTRDFHRVYGNAVACPLLAKRSYIETGFITPRPWEAIMFGTVPVGIKQMPGIEQYTKVQVGSGREMREAVEGLASLTLHERDILRRENAEMLGFMDASHLVDTLEAVADGSEEDVEEVHHG